MSVGPEVRDAEGTVALASSSRLTGILLVALSATSFASGTVMVKLAFGEGAGLGVLVVSRLGLGALLLWGLALVGRVTIKVPPRRWPAVWWMGALSAGVGVLLFGATERIPASTTTLLLYVYPALVAAISVALGRERPSATKIAALAIGLLGVLLVLGTPTSRLDPIGIALALSAALALALYVIAAQRGAAGMSPLVAGALILSAATVVYLPFGLLTGELTSGGIGDAWWLVVGVGLATGAAIALFLAGLARLEPIRASIGSTWEPVAAVVLSSIFLAERLSGLQLVGGLLVVAAVATLPLIRDSGDATTSPGPPIA
ncbi:MAG TPA: DMT family transporter [Actinomycetota bacterium]|nr:DMT family transporter [Actinomycetota bacterium]